MEYHLSLALGTHGYGYEPMEKVPIMQVELIMPDQDTTTFPIPCVSIELLNAGDAGKHVFMNSHIWLECRQDLNGIQHFLTLHPHQLELITRLLDWWFYNQDLHKNLRCHEPELAAWQLSVQVTAS